MALLGKRVAVSIPDTVLEEKESPRDKTAKLGLIARVCVIYGVDVIEVFRDPRGRGEGAKIRKVLEYLETPQYLRRRLFPLDEMLKYAGVLPPLRIPSHKAKVSVDALRVGEVREGVTNGDGTVDIGLDSTVRLREKAAAGSRITVRIASVKPLVGDQVSRDRLEEYWGYKVEEKPSTDILLDTRFGVKVATSRLGTPLGEALVPLGASTGASDSVKLVFGSPSRGLFDIFGRDLVRQVDFVVNLFPGQQVETVRTEEAIFAGLGLLSLLSVRKA